MVDSSVGVSVAAPPSSVTTSKPLLRNWFASSSSSSSSTQPPLMPAPILPAHANPTINVSPVGVTSATKTTTTTHYDDIDRTLYESSEVTAPSQSTENAAQQASSMHSSKTTRVNGETSNDIREAGATSNAEPQLQPQQQPQKTSRRTTSLLNLFMSNSQGMIIINTKQTLFKYKTPYAHTHTPESHTYIIYLHQTFR